MSKTESEIEEWRGTASYVQLFIYRIPKKNHEDVARAQSKLKNIFKKHGMLRSEFFQLSYTETFQGFTSIAKIVSANPDEEVWLELEYYKDQGHRDKVVAEIGQDPNAGPLFGQVMGLLAQGSSSIQGDFISLNV